MAGLLPVMRRLRAVRPSQERWRWTYLSSIERSERNASIDNIERSEGAWRRCMQAAQGQLNTPFLHRPQKPPRVHFHL